MLRRRSLSTIEIKTIMHRDVYHENRTSYMGKGSSILNLNMMQSLHKTFSFQLLPITISKGIMEGIYSGIVNW